MKKIVCILFALVFMLTGLTACGKEEAENTAGKDTAGKDTTAKKPADSGMPTAAAPIGKHHVEIDIKNYGVIALELDGDAAPITVQNFLDLANSGFYNNGLTFHRIIKGFMIQGGDPEGTGMGGSGKNIKGEFAQNGIDNPIKHKRGVISMARSGHPDSASSQFYIVHKDSPHLDGGYAAFGVVTSGIEIVDKICDDTPVTDSNGSVAKANQPVINTVRVVD